MFIAFTNFIVLSMKLSLVSVQRIHTAAIPAGCCVDCWEGAGCMGMAVVVVEDEMYPGIFT